MMGKIKCIFLYLFLPACLSVQGQKNGYNYFRELKVPAASWQKIIIPDEMFGHLRSDFNDIRITGINGKNDTIEVPYVLKQLTDYTGEKEIIFNLLNRAHNQQGYYFTFEIPSLDPVNRIRLDFKQENFDWRLILEGSHNQLDWFNILENYRILSIHNDLTNYSFTNIIFGKSQYKYYRIKISSDIEPGLSSARVMNEEVSDGIYRSCLVSSMKMTQDKKSKKSLLDINLLMPVPVSFLEIFVHDKYDYYRNIKIQYPVDSFQTEKGWKCNYQTLSQGYISSFEKGGFHFNNTMLNKLKVTIENYDNGPLSIDSIRVKGNVVDLIARFNTAGTYFLVYGRPVQGKPVYDLESFKEKIPASPAVLSIGPEQSNIEVNSMPSLSLIQTRLLVWGIIGLIIFVLGWFTIKMISNKHDHEANG